MQHFNVWQNAWKTGYDEPLDLTLPDDWTVEYHELGGDHFPELTREQMREKINTPIGAPTIREMAAAGHQAVIVFDDLSRGTKVQPIAEIVLEELLAGGMPKENIRFICALGNHGAMNRVDMVRKLGENIVRNYRVYNHNAFGNLVEIGRDKGDKPVLINREFWECDVRIGIGSCTPHPMNGFGGGPKLFFPGLAGIETTAANHLRREFTKMGNQKCNFGFRQDIEMLMGMVDGVFKIDAIINAHMDIVDLYAGDPVQEHYEAMKSAAVVNAIEMGAPKDVVVVNANAKYNESNISLNVASEELKPGGDIVLINHCEVGFAVHYLFGAFGTNSGGPAFTPYENRKQVPYDRVILYTPWPDPFSINFYDQPRKVVFATTWDEVLALLAEKHGEGTTAAVISDGTISYHPALLPQD